jgi:hypothetical protein
MKLCHEDEREARQVSEKANSAILAIVRHSLTMLWSFVLFAVCFQAATAQTAWAQSAVDEYHVKAAFLFHFAQLVEWPADTPSDGSNALFLCTLGDDPFHGDLERTIEGKKIGSQTLRIRHVKPSQVQGCNLLFIGKGEDARLVMIFAALRNMPVLTVGETDDFLGAGGMIRLCLEGQKVRFEINRQAADAARLRISSQLLLLAKNVAGGSGGR